MDNLEQLVHWACFDFLIEDYLLIELDKVYYDGQAHEACLAMSEDVADPPSKHSYIKETYSHIFKGGKLW